MNGPKSVETTTRERQKKKKNENEMKTWQNEQFYVAHKTFDINSQGIAKMRTDATESCQLAGLTARDARVATFS